MIRWRPCRAALLRSAVIALAVSGATMASGGDSAIAAARHAADAAIARGDPVSAEVGIRKAIAQTHADDALRAWLAQALLGEGDRNAARRVLDAGALTPDSAGLGWRVRGLIALADGDLRGAAAAFDQALNVAPHDADLWVAIASMRFTGGEQAASEAAADRAVALDPRNPRALALRGMLIREQYGLSAALPWFEQALLLHPDEPALLDAYASTLVDMGEYRAALIVARKLYDVEPKNQRARLIEAVVAARAGQTELARSILQRTGTAFRDMPAAMLLTGVLEYRAGNVDLAVEALERLVDRQPDNLLARHVLARALAAKADWRRLVDRFDGDVTAGRAGPDLVALVGTAWTRLAARGGDAQAHADRERGRALIARAAAMTGAAPAAALPANATLAVLAQHYADNPRAAGNAVPYIRALIAAHQADVAQSVADRLREDNAGNTDANLLAGDVRMIRGEARGALIDYTNAAAIRFNVAVLVRMDAALRAARRGADADAMTSRYLAQNPESVTAMTLLAAGWAGNPARAHDLLALRKAILARGVQMPLVQAPSTAGGKTG
ncbi:lipopolysaccharide assembly protein LapB [Novosphingobium sp. FSW06-99]|uniref:tetratricopeptide repeat protein n=1 Tax=Novosphingobium sp. FSW06-99 TaxID=1739113 RepID=UPI000A55D55F|nr:tetratricopeptide repeat protein [Novosphingobium sp. FSW06-99]